jgi:hypothetical protein
MRSVLEKPPVMQLLKNVSAEGPPLVGCPRLLIQYIHSYPPYLEAVSSIRNVRTRHAMATRDPPNMDFSVLFFIIELSR